jgi:hypothetical protein
MRPTMIVDESDHGRAVELRRRKNKRLPCVGSRWPSRSGSPARGPSACPPCRSERLPAIDLGLLDQSCGLQPILAAIDVTAAQREGCSPA